MRHAIPPLEQTCHRIATAGDEVAGVQTHIEGGQLHDLLNLPRCFDVGPCLVVEHRLETAVTAQSGCSLSIHREGLPLLIGVSEFALVHRAARHRTTMGLTDHRNGGTRRR